MVSGEDEVIVDLWGRPVRLPAERWLHITNPNGRHPYMVYLRAELELTLQDPEVVRKSRDYPDTVRIYCPVVHWHCCGQQMGYGGGSLL